MKLVYCISDYFSAGGTERTLSVQANYFAEKGHEVHIVSTDKSELEIPFYSFSDKIKFHNLNINYFEVDGSTSIFSIIKRIRLGNLHRRLLLKLLEEINPDITFSMFGHDLSFLYKLNDGSKKVAEFHFFRYFRDLEFKINSSSYLGYWFAKLKERRKWSFINRYDAFVVLTDEDAANWVDKRNVYVIPNALPEFPDKISDCQSKRIISVGRLSPQKGYDLLLKVWKIVYSKHPDWTLDIFGKGECFDKLKKQMIDDDVKNCNINCPQKNIYEEYAKSSIYVLTSRYEGFGIVLIEAMSCGVPCVSFACPCGPSEIITSGEDGFVVPDGNIEEMADKLCYLIDNSEKRIEMGMKARNNVSRYSVDRVMDKWEKLLNNLIKKN